MSVKIEMAAPGQNGKGPLMPACEAQESGVAKSGLGEAVSRVLGPSGRPRVRRFLSEGMSLVEQGAKAGQLGIDESQPGALLVQRISEKVADAGGWNKLSGPVRTLFELIDVGAWGKIGAKQGRAILDEALGSGSFDSLMLDAQHKALIKGWRYRVGPWDQVASNIRDVADFKTQYAIQVGSTGPYEKVYPGAPYGNVQFTDDRASYTVAKYGAIYAVNFEAVTNDDLGALQKTAERLGMGFQFTVEKFLFYTLLDSNPTIYDSTALFTSGHANALGASKVLSHDNLESACKKMRAQTDLDGNPLMLEPKYLLVHTDELYEAERLLNKESIERPGTANRDINVFRGRMIPIASNRITSGRWYVIADPAQTDTFELGFLNGERMPELMSEAVDAGRRFDFDEHRWRGRLVFGGAVVDYRGVVGANFSV